jgi:hypothetical protein
MDLPSKMLVSPISGLILDRGTLQNLSGRAELRTVEGATPAALKTVPLGHSHMCAVGRHLIQLSVRIPCKAARVYRPGCSRLSRPIWL